MYSLSLPPLHLHQAELQMAQQENRRLNLELQEAKDQQEEQSAQAQRLKDKVAQMKDTLGQVQQRVVSESHARGAALRGEGTAEVQLS